MNIVEKEPVETKAKLNKESDYWTLIYQDSQ